RRSAKQVAGVSKHLSLMAATEKLEKLAGLGSAPLAPKSDLSDGQQWLPLSARHKDPLLYLLSLRNGFYAIESALHVFPFSMLDCCNRQDLLRWNAPDLWKYAYSLDDDGLFCFAEDVFGYQCCVHEDRIGHFDPETGAVSDRCGSLDDWAARRRGQGYKDAGVTWHQELFGWSGGRMNKVLLRALVECVAFAELGGDDVIDPDAAVGLMEQIAALLHELEPPDRAEFVAFVE